MMDSSSSTTEFDKYATDYDLALAEGLSISGEDKNYFARGRIAWLARCLKELVEKPRSALDFGCGTGSATPYLFGSDRSRVRAWSRRSAKSLDAAQRTYGSERAQFLHSINTSRMNRSTWCSAMGSSTISRSVGVKPRSSTSTIYCCRADCSRFGKTTLGIRARVM